MNNFVILFIFIIIILLLYWGITYYKKKHFINYLLREWYKQTNGGFIKYENNPISNYTGDYYLCIDKENTNHYSHIHLFITSKKYDISYIIKRNNKHSKLYIIDKNKNVKSTVKEMIYNYYNFML